jgi:hypothetical protein
MSVAFRTGGEVAVHTSSNDEHSTNARELSDGRNSALTITLEPSFSSRLAAALRLHSTTFNVFDHQLAVERWDET